MADRIITRDMLIAAYKSYVEEGVTNPLDIPDGDEVSRLELAYHAAQAELASSRSPAEEILNDVLTTTIPVEAGFTDIKLLQEIAEDWLIESLASADQLGDEALIVEIKRVIEGVGRRIKELDPNYIPPELE